MLCNISALGLWQFFRVFFIIIACIICLMFFVIVYTLLLAVGAVKWAVGQHKFSNPCSVVPALQAEGAIQKRPL